MRHRRVNLAGGEGGRQLSIYYGLLIISGICARVVQKRKIEERQETGEESGGKL